MQYCSLQHRTLLLSPVTSTTGYCFCFGSIPSFFLELFLHWAPVAYWAPTDLGSSSFSILSFCLFILFTVDRLSSFQMCNTVLLTRVIMSYTFKAYFITEGSYFLTSFPDFTCAHPLPLATTNVFSVFMSLIFFLLVSVYEWDHTMFVFLSLTSFN